MVKIALTGKMRSGKDSVADILEGRGLKRYKFSQGIWDTLDMLWGIEDSPFQEKPRKMLQDVGQKLREIDENVWVNYVLEGAMWCENVVITDLRQPNEYKRLREEGYIIIRVSAPESIRKQRANARGDIFSDEDMKHETESHVDGFEVDYEISNDGTFEDLERKVEEIYRSITGE